MRQANWGYVELRWLRDFFGCAKVDFAHTLLTGGVLDHHNAGDMLIERIDGGLKIRTPAKVNLFLEVLDKRADGYHEIDTIMCPVSVVDELTVQRSASSGVQLQVHAPRAEAGDPAWHIPTDQTNLIAKALHQVDAAIGRSASQPAGWSVTVEKRIPSAAGLGGGSSDAAAAIVAGLVLSGGWHRQTALEVASRIGSDIPLFLGDPDNGIGLARATGRGECVELLPDRPPLCFVISHPPLGSSTAEVYKHCQPGKPARSCNQMLKLCKDARCHSSMQTAMDCFETELVNALQAPASRLNPWIERQLAAFASFGKPRAMMTGSGSACFAIVDSLDQGHIIANKLIELGLPRAYVAPAWYAAPIEQQLERIHDE